MPRMYARTLFFVCLLLAAGCDEVSGRDPALTDGGSHDSGASDGASGDTGGSSDSGAPSDALGTQDANPSDSGGPSCAALQPEISASNGWSNAPQQAAALNTLQLSLQSRPAAAQLDGIVAVGSQSVAAFADAAILVRFATNGTIDARDGATYSSDSAISYQVGTWYSITINADLSSRTYDVDVGPCGEPQQRLITGAAFRSDAPASTQLDHWALYAPQSATLEASGASWNASGSCTPASCSSLGFNCGSHSDGCGKTLSCGSCKADETCSGGSCVKTPVGSPTTCPGSTISAACFCGGTLYSSGFCCDGGFSFSACPSKTLYVRPGGGGTKSGADWANALDGLPATLQRDTLYWLGAGSYGGYTFDDGASGQLGITLRKATATSHGTATGWSTSYGSGQANFGALTISGTRITLDGGEPNGIRAVDAQLKNGTQVADIPGSHIVLRQVELDGGFQRSGGKQTAGACNGSNISGDYVVLDHCEIHDLADDGVGVYGNHIKLLHSRIHALHGCGTDNGCGVCYNGHSDGLELSGTSDVEVAGCMIYDIQSTSAVFMQAWGGPISDLVFHDNILYTPDTGLTMYIMDVTNIEVHNNVIWGRTQGSHYGGLAIGKNITNLSLTNNIILNINYSHLGATHDPANHKIDYNLFGMIDGGEYTANTHDTTGDPKLAIPISGNAADHKTDITITDFTPAAGSPAIDSGTSTAMPAFDINGTARPQGNAWDRGCVEQ